MTSQKPRRAAAAPAPRFAVVPQQADSEHHSQCPICGHWVDELDLEEVLQHPNSPHEAPRKN